MKDIKKSCPENTEVATDDHIETTEYDIKKMKNVTKCSVAYIDETSNQSRKKYVKPKRLPVQTRRCVAPKSSTKFKGLGKIATEPLGKKCSAKVKYKRKKESSAVTIKSSSNLEIMNAETKNICVRPIRTFRSKCKEKNVPKIPVGVKTSANAQNMISRIFQSQYQETDCTSRNEDQPDITGDTDDKKIIKLMSAKETKFKDGRNSSYSKSKCKSVDKPDRQKCVRNLFTKFYSKSGFKEKSIDSMKPTFIDSCTDPAPVVTSFEKFMNKIKGIYKTHSTAKITKLNKHLCENNKPVSVKSSCHILVQCKKCKKKTLSQNDDNLVSVGEKYKIINRFNNKDKNISTVARNVKKVKDNILSNGDIKRLKKKSKNSLKQIKQLDPIQDKTSFNAIKNKIKYIFSSKFAIVSKDVGIKGKKKFKESEKRPVSVYADSSSDLVSKENHGHSKNIVSSNYATKYKNQAKSNCVTERSNKKRLEANPADIFINPKAVNEKSRVNKTSCDKIKKCKKYQSHTQLSLNSKEPGTKCKKKSKTSKKCVTKKKPVTDDVYKSMGIDENKVEKSGKKSLIKNSVPSNQYQHKTRSKSVVNQTNKKNKTKSNPLSMDTIEDQSSYGTIKNKIKHIFSSDDKVPVTKCKKKSKKHNVEASVQNSSNSNNNANVSKPNKAYDTNKCAVDVTPINGNKGKSKNRREERRRSLESVKDKTSFDVKNKIKYIFSTVPKHTGTKGKKKPNTSKKLPVEVYPENLWNNHDEEKVTRANAEYNKGDNYPVPSNEIRCKHENEINNPPKRSNKKYKSDTNDNIDRIKNPAECIYSSQISLIPKEQSTKIKKKLKTSEKRPVKNYTEKLYSSVQKEHASRAKNNKTELNPIGLNPKHDQTAFGDIKDKRKIKNLLLKHFSRPGATRKVKSKAPINHPINIEQSSDIDENEHKNKQILFVNRDKQEIDNRAKCKYEEGTPYDKKNKHETLNKNGKHETDYTDIALDPIEGETSFQIIKNKLKNICTNQFSSSYKKSDKQTLLYNRCKNQQTYSNKNLGPFTEDKIINNQEGRSSIPSNGKEDESEHMAPVVKINSNLKIKTNYCDKCLDPIKDADELKTKGTCTHTTELSFCAKDHHQSKHKSKSSSIERQRGNKKSTRNEQENNESSSTTTERHQHKPKQGNSSSRQRKNRRKYNDKTDLPGIIKETRDQCKNKIDKLPRNKKNPTDELSANISENRSKRNKQRVPNRGKHTTIEESLISPGVAKSKHKSVIKLILSRLMTKNHDAKNKTAINNCANLKLSKNKVYKSNIESMSSDESSVLTGDDRLDIPTVNNSKTHNGVHRKHSNLCDKCRCCISPNNKTKHLANWDESRFLSNPKQSMNIRKNNRFEVTGQVPEKDCECLVSCTNTSVSEIYVPKSVKQKHAIAKKHNSNVRELHYKKEKSRNKSRFNDNPIIQANEPIKHPVTTCNTKEKRVKRDGSPDDIISNQIKRLHDFKTTDLIEIQDDPKELTNIAKPKLKHVKCVYKSRDLHKYKMSHDKLGCKGHIKTGAKRRNKSIKDKNYFGDSSDTYRFQFGSTKPSCNLRLFHVMSSFKRRGNSKQMRNLDSNNKKQSTSNKIKKKMRSCKSKNNSYQKCDGKTKFNCKENPICNLRQIKKRVSANKAINKVEDKLKIVNDAQLSTDSCNDHCRKLTYSDGNSHDNHEKKIKHPCKTKLKSCEKKTIQKMGDKLKSTDAIPVSGVLCDNRSQTCKTPYNSDKNTGILVETNVKSQQTDYDKRKKSTWCDVKASCKPNNTKNDICRKHPPTQYDLKLHHTHEDQTPKLRIDVNCDTKPVSFYGKISYDTLNHVMENIQCNNQLPIGQELRAIKRNIVNNKTKKSVSVKQTKTNTIKEKCICKKILSNIVKKDKSKKYDSIPKSNESIPKVNCCNPNTDIVTYGITVQNDTKKSSNATKEKCIRNKVLSNIFKKDKSKKYDSILKSQGFANKTKIDIASDGIIVQDDTKKSTNTTKEKCPCKRVFTNVLKKDKSEKYDSIPKSNIDNPNRVKATEGITVQDDTKKSTDATKEKCPCKRVLSNIFKKNKSKHYDSIPKAKAFIPQTHIDNPNRDYATEGITVPDDAKKSTDATKEKCPCKRVLSNIFKKNKSKHYDSIPKTNIDNPNRDIATEEITVQDDTKVSTDTTKEKVVCKRIFTNVFKKDKCKKCTPKSIGQLSIPKTRRHNIKEELEMLNIENNKYENKLIKPIEDNSEITNNTKNNSISECATYKTKQNMKNRNFILRKLVHGVPSSVACNIKAYDHTEKNGTQMIKNSPDQNRTIEKINRMPCCGLIHGGMENKNIINNQNWPGDQSAVLEKTNCRNCMPNKVHTCKMMCPTNELLCPTDNIPAGGDGTTGKCRNKIMGICRAFVPIHRHVCASEDKSDTATGDKTCDIAKNRDLSSMYSAGDGSKFKCPRVLTVAEIRARTCNRCRNFLNTEIGTTHCGRMENKSEPPTLINQPKNNKCNTCEEFKRIKRKREKRSIQNNTPVTPTANSQLKHKESNMSNKRKQHKKPSRFRRRYYSKKCDMYWQTTRDKSCYCCYRWCPWCYFRCKSLLQVWQCCMNVVCFTFAIASWIPCIIILLLCKYFSCLLCFFWPTFL